MNQRNVCVQQESHGMYSSKSSRGSSKSSDISISPSALPNFGYGPLWGKDMILKAEPSSLCYDNLLPAGHHPDQFGKSCLSLPQCTCCMLISVMLLGSGLPSCRSNDPETRFWVLGSGSPLSTIPSFTSVTGFSIGRTSEGRFCIETIPT